MHFTGEKRSEIGEAGFQFAAEYFEIQKTSQRFVRLVEEYLNWVLIQIPNMPSYTVPPIL